MEFILLNNQLIFGSSGALISACLWKKRVTHVGAGQSLEIC